MKNLKSRHKKQETGRDWNVFGFADRTAQASENENECVNFRTNGGIRFTNIKINEEYRRNQINHMLGQPNIRWATTYLHNIINV